MMIQLNLCLIAVPKVGVEPTRLFRTTDFEADGDSQKQAFSANVPSESHEMSQPVASNGQSVGNPDARELELADPVECALAVALEGAARAAQWTTVEILTRELEARRRARAGVVDLAKARAKRRE
jgi:hypothetical protein